MLSFSILTLSISYLVSIFHFDPNILRLIAVLIIGILGLSLAIPSFSAILESQVSKVTGRIGGGKRRKGFYGGFITGISLGVVWAPCAGPILATIATLAATKAVNLQIIAVTAVYCLGVGIPLFFFSYAGSQILNKSRLLSPYTGRIQQIFGIIMILTAIAIFTNYDKVLQVKLLDAFPSYQTFLLKLESNKAVTKEIDNLKGNKIPTEVNITMPFPKASSLPRLGKAPELTGITKWINTPAPLSLSALKGKVILIDFWTYTCINCIRTLPHITRWYDKYKDQGFVVLGIHTPEFEFEKKTENVENAIIQYQIHYPVAQDNDYKTWEIFANHYWPAHYLIDKDGYIRKTHFGEGEYGETEEAIQILIKEAGSTASASLETMPDLTPKDRISPETYIGSRRMAYLYPNGSIGNGKQNFTISQDFPGDEFSLGGEWTVEDEYSTTGKSAVIEYNFTADKVYLVMRPEKSGTKKTVKVYLDNKIPDSNSAGSDVKSGIVTIDSDRLYTLVNLKGNTSKHKLRLEFDEGISVYAFTFG